MRVAVAPNALPQPWNCAAGDLLLRGRAVVPRAKKAVFAVRLPVLVESFSEPLNKKAVCGISR